MLLSCSLGYTLKSGRNGRLGALLPFSAELQDGEVCHRREQENRNIVSTLSAGRSGIHYRVSCTACPPDMSMAHSRE